MVSLPCPSPSRGVRRPAAALRAGSLALCLAAVLSGRAAAELREWKDAQGRPLLARFVEVKGGMVVLEKENGAKSQIPLLRLSAADQALARELAAATPAAPAPAAAAGAPAPHAGGREKDKDAGIMALPASAAEIAYLPGAVNSFDGFYAHKPAGAAERKLWPTLLVFPAHGGAQAEIPRYQKAADEAGWLVIFANDSLGQEAEIRKRNAAFVTRVLRHLPVDKRRFYLAGGPGPFQQIPGLFEVERKLSATGFLATGGAGGYFNSTSLPKDALVYVISPAGTRDRYGSAQLHERADNKASRLIFNKGTGEATADQVREALLYLNAQFFRTATGKSPEFKAERDAFVEKLLKEVAEKKDFDPVWAADLNGVLEGFPLPPDQMKKVKETAREIEAKEDMVKYRKYEKDLAKYIGEHLGKGYDEKKIDDQLKKMQKDAEKLAEKHKDVKRSDLFKALADKPAK